MSGHDSEAVPTLLEWAGGPSAIRRLIDAFYNRVERDNLLGLLFPGGVSAEHRHHVTLWWTEVFGGPPDYTQLGGYERMLDHHRNLAITAEQRFRFASLMSLAADDAALPDDAEFRAAFVGYLEWGTRLAVINSGLGENPIGQSAPSSKVSFGRSRRKPLRRSLPMTKVSCVLRRRSGKPPLRRG